MPRTDFASARLKGKKKNCSSPATPCILYAMAAVNGRTTSRWKLPGYGFVQQNNRATGRVLTNAWFMRASMHDALSHTRDERRGSDEMAMRCGGFASVWRVSSWQHTGWSCFSCWWRLAYRYGRLARSWVVSSHLLHLFTSASALEMARLKPPSTWEAKVWISKEIMYIKHDFSLVFCKENTLKR